MSRTTKPGKRGRGKRARMPKQVQVAARISPKVKRAVDKVCKARGIKLAHFVETALIDHLEEIFDAGEIERLRSEPRVPYRDVFPEGK
jgi:hypothetical protein